MTGGARTGAGVVADATVACLVARANARRRFSDGLGFGVGVGWVRAQGKCCGGVVGGNSVVKGDFFLRRGLRLVLGGGGTGLAWLIVGKAERHGLIFVIEAYVGVAGGWGSGLGDWMEVDDLTANVAQLSNRDEWRSGEIRNNVTMLGA